LTENKIKNITTTLSDNANINNIKDDKCKMVKRYTIKDIANIAKVSMKTVSRVTVLRDGKLISTKFTKDLSYNDIVKMMVGRTIEDKISNI